MGAGTNVQSRLVAVHHLDVGLKPSDMTQRNGRHHPAGQYEYRKSEVFNYVTEGTFDSYLFQTLKITAAVYQPNHDFKIPGALLRGCEMSRRYLTPKSRHCVPEIRSSRRRWIWDVQSRKTQGSESRPPEPRNSACKTKFR
ncbi:MAG: hypothetical protein ACLU9R_04290 [Faecalibacterium sp.]